MMLDLGDDPSRLRPAPRLVSEALGIASVALFSGAVRPTAWRKVDEHETRADRVLSENYSLRGAPVETESRG